MFYIIKQIQQLMCIIIVSTNSLVAFDKDKNDSVSVELLHSSFSGFKIDTIYSYNFILPTNGYYEILSGFNSEKLCDEASKANKLTCTNFYKTDTVKIQTSVFMDKKMLFQTVDTFTCALNSEHLLFRTHTSKKYPVGVRFELQIKILRLDCKFPYDDVKFYVDLNQAGFLR